MRRLFLLAAWALASALPAHADEAHRAVTPRTAAAANAVGRPNISVPTTFSAPGPALSLLPRGANLALNPAVAAAMSNPVPATALGMPAAYFTTRLPVAAEAPAPTALAAGAELAAAADPKSARAVETVSSAVFDKQSAADRPAVAAPPYSRSSDYLEATRRLAGRALLAALTQITSVGHTPRHYSDAKEAMFSVIDQVYAQGPKGVLSAYSQKFVRGRGPLGESYLDREGTPHRGRSRVDIMTAEHLWPQMYLSKETPARADLHNIMPAFEYDNDLRGISRFDAINHPGAHQNAVGTKFGHEVVEPIDAAKGPFARALLYMYVRYHDEGLTDSPESRRFWNDSLKTLLAWNRRYPPKPHEKLRNDRIAAFQNNRNPFVDDPSLADRVDYGVWHDWRP